MLSNDPNKNTCSSKSNKSELLGKKPMNILDFERIKGND